MRFNLQFYISALYALRSIAQDLAIIEDEINDLATRYQRSCADIENRTDRVSDGLMGSFGAIIKPTIFNFYAIGDKIFASYLNAQYYQKLSFVSDNLSKGKV